MAVAAIEAQPVVATLGTTAALPAVQTASARSPAFQPDAAFTAVAAADDPALRGRLDLSRQDPGTSGQNEGAVGYDGGRAATPVRLPIPSTRAALRTR